MIPDSFLEELKQRCDIESLISSYVLLKRAGRNLKGLCPFHSEKTPSFVVYPESQSFYCFGCGAGGDAISFIMRAENLEYIEAVKFLAEKAGLPMPENTAEDRTGKRRMRILEMNREAARFFHRCLVKGEDRRGLEYLANRGMDKKMIIRFGLGYAPDSWNALRDHLQQKGYSWEEMLDAALVIKGRNGSVYDTFRGRVIFPIIDLRGNVIGFGGRVLSSDKGPKYLNSSDTLAYKKSRNLFAMNFAKNAADKRLILCEGYMDTVSMHQAGFDNAVATLGTALTMRHIRVLAKHAPKKIVYLFDGDAAGQKAADRALAFIGESISDKNRNSVELLAVTLPNNQDPAEFVQAEGAQALEAVVEGALPLIEFGLERRLDSFNLDTAPGRDRALDACLAVLAPIKDTLVAKDYAVRTWSRLRAHGRLGIEEADVLERGLSSLNARMQAHFDRARALAEYLAANEMVRNVCYPGLNSHPDHAVATGILEHGFGPVVEFDLIERSAGELFDALPGEFRTSPAGGATTRLSAPRGKQGSTIRLFAGTDDPLVVASALDSALRN